MQSKKKYTNQRTGETFEIIRVAQEGVTFRAWHPPGKGFAIKHLHEVADEHFKVLAGELTCFYKGRMIRIPKGEEIHLSRNSAHAHWNSGETMLEVEQTISPCHDTHLFLAKLFDLASMDKLDNAGQPPFLQIMVWIKKLQSKTYLAAIPVWLQKWMAFILAPCAEMMGYRAYPNQDKIF